jgi:hypothetical protein
VVERDVCKVYQLQRFSAVTVYESIIEAVSKLKIPGTKYGPEIQHESGVFSAYRSYLKIEREFSQFLVCAAPVGESYFVSVRKIDRFPHVKIIHYLLGAVAVMGLFTLSVVVAGPVGGVVFFAVGLAFLWSIMRYAAHVAKGWLAEHLHEIPVLGPLYLRWFRPDTYFRQDVHSAFMVLVDSVIKGVIQSLEQAQGVRPVTESQPSPVIRDLHAKS